MGTSHKIFVPAVVTAVCLMAFCPRGRMGGPLAGLEAFSPVSGSRFSPAPIKRASRSKRANSRDRWIEPLQTSTTTIKPRTGTTPMPVVPLCKIAWPGTTVKLNVAFPGQLRMYDDLVRTNQRRFVATLSCLPEDSKGLPEDLRMWSIGSILSLDSLIPVNQQAQNGAKYIAVHTVVGRARLHRILNPAKWFEPDADYLRAEVEELPEVVPRGSLVDNRIDLVKSFDRLRALSEHTGWPAVEDRPQLMKKILQSSTGKLAQLLQDWRIASVFHREMECMYLDVDDWIDDQLAQSSRSNTPPDSTEELTQAYAKSQPARVIEFRSDFWEPLLRVFATDDAEARRALILKIAEDEVEMSQARKALKDLVG